MMDHASLTRVEDELNRAIQGGDLLGAFEKYYADDVQMQDNSDLPRKGKTVNREYEKAFVDSVAEVHAIKLLGSAVGDGVTYSEWMFDLSFKNGARSVQSQVCARRWNNGKVVSERFYYNKQ